jgi:hypothetical protein
MFNKHWVSPLIIVRRKHADPSAVPADEGFSNCAMPTTDKDVASDSKVPWNLSVITKSSRWIQRTEISITPGCGALADRGYNHPSRSGKNDGVARRWVRNQVLISRRRECRTAGAGGAAAAGRDDEFDSEFCSDWHRGWRTAMAAMMAVAPKILARYLRVEVNGLDEVFLLPDCRVASCCEAARWKY